MSKNQNVASPEPMETIGEAMSKTELFFENNGRKITYAIFAILALSALIFGYKLLVVEPQMKSASEMIANAQGLFEQSTPNYDAALNGDENGAGFLEVIENYGSTPAGNIAKHYAGICYLYLGDLDNATKYLSQYKAVEGIPAEIINAQNFGLQGDIAVNKGEFDKAIKLYTKAFESSDNSYTTPIYMRKAAIVAIEKGDAAKAKELLAAIITEYPNTNESREAEKTLGTIK